MTTDSTITALASAMEEIRFWRRDAAARLEMGLALLKAQEQKGEADEAAKTYLLKVQPAFAALRDALAEAFVYPICPLCDHPIKDGEWVQMWKDEGDTHVLCAAPSTDQTGDPDAVKYVDDIPDERIEAILAEAEVYLDHRRRAADSSPQGEPDHD